MNIKTIIVKGESETVEFKKSTGESKEIIKTISAFSNTKGGNIIIGISKLGKISGIKVGKDTLERLTNQIFQNTDPKAHPRIIIRKVKDKALVLIEIKESSDHLTLAFGRPYKRVGKSTVKMSKDEYERLILEKHKGKFQFDKQVYKSVSLNDIDWKFVKEEFIPLYERVSEKKTVSTPRLLLASLGCLKGKKPTNAGILLFGKNPQEFFMNAYIALARYKGKGVGVERLDYKEFTGNLFEQIDECNKYIKEHIAIMSKLHPYQVQREDIPEYGLFSIRELITNAVCHRDYKNQNTKVIIKMFSDAIEFYNPGGLPEDITPRNITERQYSRNPVIAKVLAKVKYIEELGEGWDKIVAEYKRHPLKPKMPKIKSDKYTSIITMFSTKQKFEKGKKTEIEVELNQRQKDVLECIKEKGKISNAGYRNIFKVSAATAKRELQDLVKKGICRTLGAGPNLRYILK